MGCPDCIRLTAENLRLKQLYAASVDRLFAIGYQVRDTEYREMKNSVEEARIQAEISAIKLEEHKLRVHAGVQSIAG
jgi:hypothetical protein